MASVNQSWPIDKNDYFLMHLFAFNDLNYHSLDAHTHTHKTSFLIHTEVCPPFSPPALITPPPPALFNNPKCSE